MNRMVCLNGCKTWVPCPTPQALAARLETARQRLGSRFGRREDGSTRLFGINGAICMVSMPRYSRRDERAAGFRPRGMTACTVLVAGLFSLSACTNVIIPPPTPPDPHPVFVLDHGHHASLVLPTGHGVVRYAYGDWNYYAREETGVLETSFAVVWPTTAGLGRRELHASATPAEVRQVVQVGIEHLHEVIVDEQAISRLRTHLDEIFHTHRETRLYNASYDLAFVHHPEAYTIVHNSNRVVARWLQALGCRVSGLRLFSRWRVEQPQAP